MQQDRTITGETAWEANADAVGGVFSGDGLLRFRSSVLHSVRPEESAVAVRRFADASRGCPGVPGAVSGDPRSAEIAARLLTESRFLAERLIRDPADLLDLLSRDRLTRRPTREEYCEETVRQMADGDPSAVIRRCHARNVTRIAACDVFHLFDLKATTQQLSLLADGLIQSTLRQLGAEQSGFAVLAFGKLGGEELNYSSDVDLLFLSDRDDAHCGRLVPVAIQLLGGGPSPAYRIDTRLRPWGTAGPLLVTADAYRSYFAANAAVWERLAFLRCRVVAGDIAFGEDFLDRIRPEVLVADPEAAAAAVTSSRRKAEAAAPAGCVKSGPGGIRDVEFATQLLQFSAGRDDPHVWSPNTRDALRRLADVQAVTADEHRILSSGYAYLRAVEHALQLRFNTQTHALPEDESELSLLAARLDFPSVAEFESFHRQNVDAVRKAFNGVVARVSRRRRKVVEREVTPAGDSAYFRIYPKDRVRQHARLASVVLDGRPVVLDWSGAGPLVELTVVAEDVAGALSVICGAIAAAGLEVVSADAFSETVREGRPPLIFDTFVLKAPSDGSAVDRVLVADRIERGVRELRSDPVGVHAECAAQVAAAADAELPAVLLPIEIEIDNEAQPGVSELTVRSRDAAGFLFELTHAVALAGLDVRRLTARTEAGVHGPTAVDTLRIVDSDGGPLTDLQRQHELRAAIVLTIHFIQLLPRSPDPRTAMTQFRQFVSGLFRNPGWVRDLASLQQSENLAALTRLLGVSEFLWHDFLRWQHSSLFPLLHDAAALRGRQSAAELRETVRSECEEAAAAGADWQAALNRFKDREMLRADMRHILGIESAFGEFGRELTDIAEAVLAEAVRHHAAEIGCSRDAEDAFCLAALGKCGGREMGFASDVELMFLYDEDRVAPSIAEDLVERAVRSVVARQSRIFEIDLRLRPYGRSGPAAVSLRSFVAYFAPDGPAWPFERQALVKLRPFLGPERLREQVVASRDAAVYCGRPVDVTAIRGMRERQVRKHTVPDRFNAKLSHGGLIDIEYFVQAQQMAYGHRHKDLRSPNTRAALKALVRRGHMDEDVRLRIRDAYRFLRRVIDGLRMVRGDARDLTVPPAGTEAREFLVRRIDEPDTASFDAALRQHVETAEWAMLSLPDTLAADADGRIEEN